MKQASEGDGFRIVCKKGGVMFILTSGMRPVNGGAVVTFDAQLAKSRGALPASERIEGPMFGYRALKIVCAGREQVPCIELIDYRPDRPLMVAAIDVNGPGTAAPADLPAILEQSRLFYDTVEVRKP